MDDIQRAIEILRKNKPTSDPRLCGKELCNACDVAMSAMRELQQYRATGLTPHMIETLKENDKRSHKLAVQRATELDEYWAIGTPEEVNELKEKLNHYEELRQQGRLFELPCAVGDTVYEVSHDDIPVPVGYIAKYPAEDVSVKGIRYAGDWIGWDELRDTYFNKEEAEERLRELAAGGTT